MTSSRAPRTLRTHSGRTHLVAGDVTTVPNGYVADPSSTVLASARNACGRTYTGETTLGEGNLDSVDCQKCRAAVDLMRERAAALDAGPADEDVCGQCGSPRSSARHTPLGHTFVEEPVIVRAGEAAPLAEQDAPRQDLDGEFRHEAHCARNGGEWVDPCTCTPRYWTAEEVAAERYAKLDELHAVTRTANTTGDLAERRVARERAAVLRAELIGGCDCPATPGPHAAHCEDCSAPADRCVCDTPTGRLAARYGVTPDEVTATAREVVGEALDPIGAATAVEDRARELLDPTPTFTERGESVHLIAYGAVTIAAGPDCGAERVPAGRLAWTVDSVTCPSCLDAAATRYEAHARLIRARHPRSWRAAEQDEAAASVVRTRLRRLADA